MTIRIAARLEAMTMELLDALDALPKPATELEIDRRLRTVWNAARTALGIGRLDQHETNPRHADEEEDMNDEAASDPEALERKHRALDAGLARFNPPLDAGATAGAAHSGRAGGREDELANEGHRCAA